MSNGNITIENAKLVFKNFEGKRGDYNPEGHRNFNVLLDDDVAEMLTKDGWAVRYLKPREEGDKPQAILKVNVKFDKWPPKVYMVSSRGKTLLNEDTVNSLDWADIETADVIITPYHWNHNGNSGISAYLKSLYAVIKEDELEKKYYDVPDSAQNTIGGCGNCDVCDGGCSCKDDD